MRGRNTAPHSPAPIDLPRPHALHDTVATAIERPYRAATQSADFLGVVAAHCRERVLDIAAIAQG